MTENIGDWLMGIRRAIATFIKPKEKMTQKPASKETIQKLHENMGINFQSFIPQLCNCNSSLESLEPLNDEEYENPEVLRLWKLLLKLHEFSLIINLDISTFLRANIRSSSNPEKCCNLKYVNVITFEGYSYLFGFGKDKTNALWEIVKKLAEQINDEELIKDIVDIEQWALEFEITYAQQEDRDKRNLSIHYDSDPIKVHNLLSQISEEFETRRASGFLKILDDITLFIGKYIRKYQIPIFCSTNDYGIDMWESINHFPDRNNKLFNELDERLVNFAEHMENVVSHCEMPKVVQEKLQLDKTFVEKLQPLVLSAFPGIHISFIYLDLACALRAYLSSEYYFEKQLNLRRINIVVYEGFKHLYGYTESDNLKSFWHRNIASTINDSKNQDIIDSLNKIEYELKGLASDNGINNKQLRECSVHYRYKEKDNIVALFYALVKSNPLIEINKSLKLINLLPKLLNINTESTNFVYNLEQEMIKSSNNKTLAQIDYIINMIDQIQIDYGQKQEMISNLLKIRSLLI